MLSPKLQLRIKRILPEDVKGVFFCLPYSGRQTSSSIYHRCAAKKVVGAFIPLKDSPSRRGEGFSHTQWTTFMALLEDTTGYGLFCSIHSPSARYPRVKYDKRH
mmetsp:Transcript_48096/g.145268  ORF Transcript_48096/g.145268 Transcript_48096/m.145268 type:complete len:104 (-) Transcript_48096:659-970(-)